MTGYIPTLTTRDLYIISAVNGHNPYNNNFIYRVVGVSVYVTYLLNLQRHVCHRLPEALLSLAVKPKITVNLLLNMYNTLYINVSISSQNSTYLS